MDALTISDAAPSYTSRCVFVSPKILSKVNFFFSPSCPFGCFNDTLPDKTSISTIVCLPSPSSLPNSGRHRTTTCTLSVPGILGTCGGVGCFFFFFNLADGETFAQNTKDAALRPFSILYNARFGARNDDHTAVGLPYLPPPVTVRPGHFSGSPRRADGVCGSRDDEVPKKSAVVIKQKTRRIISVNEIIRHPFERRPHRAPRGLAAPWFRSRPRAGWWSVGSGWTEPRLGRR
mmetsp:Transcript_6950/g.26251  ORF Transcript_6950/g.26251 Transcript_6950/m.26251 type:complete len:233 (+) Transcript_6950:938-1636(+)